MHLYIKQLPQTEQQVYCRRSYSLDKVGGGHTSSSVPIPAPVEFVIRLSKKVQLNKQNNTQSRLDPLINHFSGFQFINERTAESRSLKPSINSNGSAFLTIAYLV